MKPELMTILTVDDTPANIRLLTHYLEKQGYRVLTAEDGFEGFKAAIQYHPDLVLLDVMMPGTDGYEVCELLKAEEETKDIPVMFLTAKADVEDRVRGFELGAVDYITKPFNLVEISTRVKSHLRLKYLEKQRVLTQRILLQMQKLASLGESDAVFFNRLSRLSEEMNDIIGKAPVGKSADSDRMKTLVKEARDILADIKAFVNTSSNDTDTIRINELVDSVHELIEPVIRNGVRLEIELPKESPVVTGNLGLLHQAILNIALNALESAIGGGTVVLRVTTGPLPEDLARSVPAAALPEYAGISITDAAVRKEPIRFDPGDKIYNTTHNNLNAGIRLTAAHAIVERYGGLFSLSHGEGGRNTVRMYLPALAA